jgi:hypothetical protein
MRPARGDQYGLDQSLWFTNLTVAVIPPTLKTATLAKDACVTVTHTHVYDRIGWIIEWFCNWPEGLPPTTHDVLFVARARSITSSLDLDNFAKVCGDFELFSPVRAPAMDLPSLVKSTRVIESQCQRDRSNDLFRWGFDPLMRLAPTGDPALACNSTNVMVA